MCPIPSPGLPEPTLVHPANGGVLSGQVSSGGWGVRDEVRHLGWGRWVEVKVRTDGLREETAWSVLKLGWERQVPALLPGPEIIFLPEWINPEDPCFWGHHPCLFPFLCHPMDGDLAPMSQRISSYTHGTRAANPLEGHRFPDLQSGRRKVVLGNVERGPPTCTSFGL